MLRSGRFSAFGFVGGRGEGMAGLHGGVLAAISSSTWKGIFQTVELGSSGVHAHSPTASRHLGIYGEPGPAEAFTCTALYIPYLIRMSG